MKSKYFVFVFLSIVCCLVISCQDRNIKKEDRTPASKGVGKSPEVVQGVPKTVGESVLLQPIYQYPMAGEVIDKKFMLVFDKKVYFPSDVSVDDYIKTEPPLRGVVECLGNAIVFNLLQDLPTDVEDIKICVHPQLQSEDGLKIDPQKLCYQLPTKGIKVLEGQFKDVNESRFLFSLKFSQAVLAGDVKSFILLTNKDGGDVEFSVQDTGNPTEVVDLEIKRSADEPYKMLIKPGYWDSEKRYKGQGAYFEFPLKERLEVVECKVREYGYLQITFSRPVSGSVILKSVYVTYPNQARIEYNAIPADWGMVNEPVISTAYTMANVEPDYWRVLDAVSSSGKTFNVGDYIKEKGSKSWLLKVKPGISVDIINVGIKQYTWSTDYALLQEEYKWTSQRSTSDFKIDYIYWNNKGLDGVSCSVNMPPIDIDKAINYLEIIPPVENLLLQTKGWGNIQIDGDWKSGINYVMKWKAGLEWGGDSISGYKVLSNDYVYPLAKVPEYKTLDFANDDKYYIVPLHEKNFVRVGSRNVPKGYIHVYEVITENLPVWIGNVSANSIPFEINERTTKYLTAIPVEFPNCIDKASYVDVDLTNYLAGYPKGVFTLCLSDTKKPGVLRASWENKASTSSGEEDDEEYERYDYEDEWGYGDENRFYSDYKGVRSDICYVLWTRLGVVSHWNDTGLIAFVHDLLDLTPQANAVVTAYSIKNRKVGEGITDNKGFVKISVDDKGLGSPYLLTVRTDKDFTFVFLVPKPLPTFKDLEKYDKYDSEGYDAFIYADRNLYRPGETIHSRWIVRTKYGSEVVHAPLELRFVNPQNKVILRKIVNLSELGTGGEDIVTEMTYLTGNYNLGLYVPGGERICGSTIIHIEDFVPDQIKTELTVSEDFWVVGSKQSVESVSHYFVGPPANDLNCKWKLVITKKEFESDKWKGYRFGNDEIFKTVVMDLGVQKTDKDGKSKLEFVFNPLGFINVPVEISTIAEVSESGGRAVFGVKKVIGYPEDIVCGLGLEKIGDKLQASVALVDKNFDPAPDQEVEVFLEKVEWTYVNRVYRGAFPQWERVFKVIEQKKIVTNNGMAVVLFDSPLPYYSYRIRAQRVGSKVFSERSFYYVPSQMIDLKDKPPELVKIHIEDKRWSVGEDVPVTIEVPFDGKAVVIVQGDKIWDGQIIDIVSGKGMFSLPIKEEYYPNVWVGVSALHVPTKEEVEISPYSSFSFAKVEVENPKGKLNLVFSDLPTEVKPQTEVEVSVRATDKDNRPLVGELTIALVDEGIHSIVGYISPDPYAWFGRARYSPIQRVHYYDHVAYHYDPTLPGGDMLARMLSSGKPEISDTWIKPVALWSGVVRTDEQGIAKASFRLPEFNGTLRIVVVGVNKELVGSVEGSLFVRRPCVIQTHLPRFLRPNDKAILFARSLNSQDVPLDVKVSMSPSEALQIIPTFFEWESKPQSLSLSPEINLTCVSGLSQAKIDWQYQIVDKQGNVVDQFSQETPIPNRIPAIYEQRRKTYMISPGEILKLDTNDFVVDDLLETEIKVGGSPLLQIEPAISWLWKYPYSCCEQKISRLYGLYLFRHYVQNSMPETINKELYNNILLTLVNEIFAHQQANGGFSLWPYSNSTDLKTSLHTALLLALINRDKELQIPEKPYRRLMEFLQDVCRRGDSENSVAWEAQAFATLILSINGDPSASERLVNYLKVDLPRNLRVMLLMGAHICGKPKEFIVPYVKLLTWETEHENVKNTYEFNSQQMRSLALKLISHVIADSSPDIIIDCQRPLIEYVSKSYSFTTYELAFVLMALDMSFKKLGVQPSECVAQININGQIEDLKGTELFFKKVKGTTQVEIQNKCESPLFVLWSIHGVPTNPPTGEESQDIQLTRMVYTQQKKVLTDNKYSQGNVYLLLFTVKPEYDVDNLILSQLLPAGLEIENPRLTPEGMDDMISGTLKYSFRQINPEHVEIRDDKLIVAFPPLESSKDLVYAYGCIVRAITKGSFEFPGARIEDMYKPEIFARLSTQQIEVE